MKRNKKNKKKAAITLIISLISILLISYFLKLEDKPSPKVVEEEAPLIEEPVSEPKEPKENVVYIDRDEKIDEVKGEDSFYDGIKEPAEEKMEDYAYLLKEEPKPFLPKLPDYMTERKIQPEYIKDFFTMSVAERYEKMEQMKLTEGEKAELEKIQSVNKNIDDSFAEADYNKFLKSLHKDYRNDYGTRMIGIVMNGKFEEETVGFFPEVIDEKLGFAYGIYFKKTVYVEDGRRGTAQWSDGVIIYKQDDAGQWEVYYEIPF